MSNKLSYPDQLIDKTIGPLTSGKRNTITEAWQKILQEENNTFDDLNELLKDPTVFPKLNDPSHDEFSDQESTHVNLSSMDIESVDSIEPSPITLRSDLKGAASYESDIAETSLAIIFPFLSTCCVSEERKTTLRYSEAQEKIKKCNTNMLKYYHQLKRDFEIIDGLFAFQASSFKGPKNMNIISAQLWFVTFALAKELSRSAEVNRADIARFRKEYHKLLSHAVRMSSQLSALELSLIQIEEKGTKQICKMKDALTGSSKTNLANSEISPHDDFLVDGTSWTELTQRQADDRINCYYHGHSYFESNPRIPRMFHSLELPDSLTDRIELDIFVKNVTKSGWMNYDQNFTFDKKIKLLQEIMSQTLETVARVMKRSNYIRKKLNAATFTKHHACLTCNDTLVPWFRDTKRFVKFCVKTAKFGLEEYEFLRFNIFSSEIRLQSIVTRGRNLRNSIQDVIDVTKLCCDLLETKYNIMLPHFEQLRHSLQRLPHEEAIKKDFALSNFYLHEYGSLLRQVPINFRISQFILSKKIPAQEYHSGADFRIRFF